MSYNVLKVKIMNRLVFLEFFVLFVFSFFLSWIFQIDKESGLKEIEVGVRRMQKVPEDIE